MSAYGFHSEDVEDRHQQLQPLFSTYHFKQEQFKVSRITPKAHEAIEALKLEHPRYAKLDQTVLMAILCTRACVQGHAINRASTGLNMGSSRGATALFETYYKHFLETGTAAALTSPTTTLGNLATWPAQDLGLKGVQMSHSITCSTALHGFLNAKAWLNSGMSDAFIVGGSEAPLTDFTIAQMKAIKLYSRREDNYPCRSLDFHKTENTLVLAEAAGSALLTKSPNAALAEVAGMGYATEVITHNISISSDARCFQDAMRMALNDANLSSVDAIIMHAPGTKKGDAAELKAIQSTFTTLPFLTTNKWQVGHSFGASGMLSLETALYLLKHNDYANPFYEDTTLPSALQTVMINAVGFGGNAVSLIIKRMD